MQDKLGTGLMTKTATAKRKRLNGNGLNLRQMKFVKGFIENGGNATKAYQAAYDGKGAEQSASALLRSPKVARAIQEALKERGYTPDAIRCKLLAYVVNDPRRFEPWFTGDKTLEQLSAQGIDTTTIQEMLVTVKPTAQGDQVTKKLRFYDSQQATTTLGRMLGMLDERKKIEWSGMVTLAALDLRDKSPDELAAIQHAIATGTTPPGLPQEVATLLDPEKETIDADVL